MKSPYSMFRMSRPCQALGAALLLLSLAAGPSSTAATVVAKGSRVLGIDVNTAFDNDYAKAFAVARGAGMQATSLVINWDEVETAPGVYQPNPNWLYIADVYYPSQNTQVLLTIVPIDTVQSRLPADLEGKPMDDPAVIERFKGLLTYAFSQIPHLQLSALSIGHEVDIYMGNNLTAWGQYQRFFTAVATHARGLRPGLKVGVQTTHDRTIGPLAAPIATLNQSSDVVMISYYPLDGNFQVKSPTVVRGDWDAVMKAYPTRQVIFAQLGYPTGIANGSSQTKQKTFIENVFTTWDVYKDRVPLVMFNWLHDLPTNSSRGLTSYYGISDSRFESFLRTLGLRTVLGTDKAGLTTLKKQALSRGW